MPLRHGVLFPPPSLPVQGNQLMRALHVAAFALSGYACTEGRVQKPFNPLLGETYEAVYPDKGWRFISEKVGPGLALLIGLRHASWRQRVPNSVHRAVQYCALA